jgi:hypothetical protein
VLLERLLCACDFVWIQLLARLVVGGQELLVHRLGDLLLSARHVRRGLLQLDSDAALGRDGFGGILDAEADRVFGVVQLAEADRAFLDVLRRSYCSDRGERDRNCSVAQ